MKFLVQRDLCGRGFLFGLVAGLAFSISISSAQTLADGLDTTNLVWTTGGNSVWFVQTTNTHDGIDAVRSGVIGSNQTSWIETTVTGPATVHFLSFTTMTPYSPSLSFMVTPDLSGQSLPSRLIGDWIEWTQDLAQGTNVLRWTAYNYYDTATQGFVALDEFSLGPPRPLTFTDEPGDQTVYAGEVGSYGGYGGYSGSGAALFIGSVIGTPPFQFQWRKDGTNLPGANTAWLWFTNVTQADSGNYSLVVSNSQGFSVSSNALLTVLPPTAPFFIYEPESAEAYSGQTTYLSGGVNGSQPFAFQWRKDGINLPGANSPWLMLTNLSPANAGNYTLLVTNKTGSVESSNAVLTVIPSVAPVITKHPRSLEVAAGVNTWMSVSATGTPDPCCVWARTDVAPPPPTFPGIPGIPVVCQYPMRWFDNVSSNDAGVYRATLGNSGGTTASREALLTVLPPIKALGSWSQGAEDIYVTNGLAFLAQGTNGLAVLSISNPASPFFLGSYNTPGFASAVRTVGDRAYVADGVSGIQIISITNPSTPVLLGNYNTPYSASDVAVRDNLAYVADGNSGLLIISVTNPAAPSLIGSYSTNLSPKHIAVSGNYAYLTSPAHVIIIGSSNDWVGGMIIVDISNPSNPIEVGRHVWPDGKIAVQDSLVYSASGLGMSVLDVRNPSTPQYVGGYSPFPSSRIWQTSNVQVDNHRAYLLRNSETNTDVIVLDIRDPSEAIPVGFYSAAGQDRALFVGGNRVYSAGSKSPFKVIETPFNTNPVSPAMLTLSATPGMQLGIHGRRGLNYALESAPSLFGQPWQVIQTFLLTNDTASVSITPSSTAGFFRLKQLD